MLSIDEQWPADEVRRQELASLVPYARNARTHSDEQVAQLAHSIQQWGWTVPVLVDEGGGIIAGHGRVLAAAQLGLADIPVMTARGWSEDKKRAYVIADNKLAANGGWDDALLRAELTDLQGLGFGADLLGFTAADLSALLGPATPDDADAGAAAEADAPANPAGNMLAKFGVPPFTTFNAREGWWQDRKRAWLAIGIQSELGRGDRPGAPATAIASQQSLTALKKSGRKRKAAA